jgi:hypothetical protein
MPAHTIEERHRLVELPLAAAQLAETHEPLAGHRRTARGELVRGGGELELASSHAPRHMHTDAY